MMLSGGKGAPIWVTIIIVVCMLPVFQTPWLLGSMPSEPAILSTMAYCYPFYLLVSGYLAYVCYNTRPWMTWILLVTSLLADVGMYALAAMS